MQMLPIHITPIGLFDNPELSMGVREWFDIDTANDNFINTDPANKFLTTLDTYMGEAKIRVPENDFFKSFEEVVLKNSTEFLKTCGYGIETKQLKLSRVWLNEMYSGSFHKRHTHYGNALSGCFYLDVPQGSGPIKFTTHLDTLYKQSFVEERYTQYNSGTWTIDAQPGNMFIWESYVPHQVPLCEFEGVRRSVAFDVVLI